MPTDDTRLPADERAWLEGIRAAAPLMDHGTRMVFYRLVTEAIIGPTDDTRPDPLREALDALRELSDASAPGPWMWLDSGGDPGEHDELQDGRGEMVASGFREDIDLGDGPINRDGSFAAAAVNYVRAALAASGTVTEGLDEPFQELDEVHVRPPLQTRALRARLSGVTKGADHAD